MLIELWALVRGGEGGEGEWGDHRSITWLIGPPFVEKQLLLNYTRFAQDSVWLSCFHWLTDWLGPMCVLTSGQQKPQGKNKTESVISLLIHSRLGDEGSSDSANLMVHLVTSRGVDSWKARGNLESLSNSGQEWDKDQPLRLLKKMNPHLAVTIQKVWRGQRVQQVTSTDHIGAPISREKSVTSEHATCTYPMPVYTETCLCSAAWGVDEDEEENVSTITWGRGVFQVMWL